MGVVGVDGLLVCGDCPAGEPGFPPTFVRVAPEGAPRSEAQGGERGHVHRQGGGLPLTPEAFGAAVSQAAAAFGFTLLEAAHFGHGATVGVRKVAGGLKGLLRMGVRKVLARHGWQLEEGAMWSARRADGAVSVDSTTARELLALARQFPVDLHGVAQALEGRRVAARLAAQEAQAWKGLFLRALVLANRERAVAVDCANMVMEALDVSEGYQALAGRDALALSEAHDRAARAEVDRDRAQDKATELGVQLEEQADRVEKLLLEVEQERGLTNAARTQVRQLDKDVENRKWAPPPARVGGLLGIHQGLSYDMSGAQSVVEVLGLKVSGRKAFKAGAMLAVARLAQVVMDSPSRWARPKHFHWCLEGTVALPEPVARKGAQGLWQVPSEVLHQVREQLLNREGLARAAVALSPTEGPPTGLEKVAAEAWAATRSPTSYYARSASTRGQVVACPKCSGLYMDYGEGGTRAHAPRLPVGTGPEWPVCPHGAALYRDCMGDPCAPPCCQRAQAGGAP